MQRVKQELGKMRRLERSSLKYFAVIFAVLAAGVYAFAIGGGIEDNLYMRGDTHTVNGFSGYKMNGSQSDTAQSAFVEKSTENLQADWGIRVWKRDVNGTMVEVTSGSPVAVVSRTANGAGIQSASWTPPQTNVNPNDALVFRVYIRVGSGWTEKAEFITNRLNASQLRNDPWTLYYYTEYDTQANGPPFNRYTRGTFRWGTSTYNSRVENLNYTLAKTVVNQAAPSTEVDTYPGQSFSHAAEVTCDASFCRDVKVYPQLCNGRSCTNFNNVNNSMGLSWDASSHSFGTMSRGETLTHNFTVTADNEGEYRIRFNVTSSNVLNNVSSSEVVDVDVTDVNLTTLEHENRFDAGVREYETTDTIDWFNTTLTSGDGTAFNLTVAPQFIDPTGDVALWGPSSRKSCGNISAGSSCEKQFSNFTVPLDAESGNYNFSVAYDWENFGPETNSTVQFKVVDVRGTFTASLEPGSVLKGADSVYNFSMVNRWSSSLQGVNVSVNCPSELQCEGLDQNYWASLGAKERIISTFNVSTSTTTPSGYYDVNVTVEYTNPNEAKTWTEVENRKLKVNDRDTLRTTIFKLPDNAYNAEYSHVINSTDTSSGLFGPLNGTFAINEGFDAQNHWVYGTWRGEGGGSLTAYHQDSSDGGWNQTNVGDGSGKEYCAVQTLPVNNTDCPTKPAGLAGFWALDESGGAAWDHIGNNHGNLNGVTQGVSGVVGPAYGFDGSSSYIQVPHSEELEMSDTNRVTVSAWVYHDTDQSGWTAIVQKSDTSYNLQLDNNVPVFTVYDGDWSTASASSALQTGRWYHLAGTFDGSTVRIYVNGQLNGTASATGIADASGWDVGIGENLDATGRHFDGRIDQVRIYERQLSQDEIQALSDLNQKLDSGVEEPRAFPEKVTRGTKFDLKGYLENLGSSTAYSVSLNWTIAQGWTNSSGTLYQFNSSIGPGEMWWNNITADISLSAGRGPHYVNLTSNSSAGDRGDKSFETLDVYADTFLDLNLNTTDVSPGEKVRADIQLNLDTGGALANQRVSLKDDYSGDSLGSMVTDSNGQASTVFTIPENWDITVHDIEAQYDGNSTIYTNPSSGVVGLAVHDLPVISNLSYTPEITGYGGKIRINATVSDSDLVQDVYLNVTYPGGASQRFKMENITQSGDYGYNFTDSWQNGVYEFRIEATDKAGYTNTSRDYQFQVRANASKNVVTDKDVYGPNQQVSLSRTKPVSRNASIEDIISTAEAYAQELFSQSFNTLLGTSTFHEETHVMDGTYFDMTEQDGAPPNTPDRFEGIYSYKTALSNISRIDINSYGSVTSGTWDVYAKDYSTDSWTQVFSATSTTDAWNNVTVCSGSTCSNYVSNGDIEIRVYTSSTRGGAEATYSVDYQKLRVEAGSGPESKDTSPSAPYTVGEDRYDRNRLYTKFNLSKLPYYQSGQVESARLVFNVPGGFGTGELYHTKNFTAAESASTIHADGTPAEQGDPNPVTTFSTAAGTKVLDVTDAVNDTFEAGKRYVGFQFREQDENTFYNISGPIYLEINYSAESELVNTGSTQMEGYLLMRVQRLESGSWQNVGLPVVDQSAGTYSVGSGGTLDLANIWDNNGGFNTQLRAPDDYRVLSKFVDADGNVLTTDSGRKIKDWYEFDIAEAQLNLTNVEHENQVDYLINQYETRDTIQWVNITINNSRAEAVDATIDLNVLDENNQSVSWGPDSVKTCGNIPAGGSCERQWNNAGSGYKIPGDATPGTFKFRWNTTLEADNAETTNNHSVGFFIHHVPSGFNAEIQDSDNKILRNESTLYNFTVQNPWSGALSNVNVTVNCPSSIGCKVLGGAGNTANIGTLGGSSSTEVAFNLTTDINTAPENYDINATVEYVNPGTERRVWRERENRILMVRIPGALLNLTQYPTRVVRQNSGYQFKSYANNTYDSDLTNETITWYIPGGWNNASGSLKVVEEIHSPGEIVWNNFTAEVFSSASLGETRVNITATNDQGREDNDFVRVEVYSNTSLGVAFNETDPAVNETIEITAALSYENGTALGGEELEFRDETTGTLIGTGVTDSSGQYTQTYSPGTPYGNHTINVSYSGSSTKYTLGAVNTHDITVHDRPNITSVSATPAIIGFGYNTTINATVDDMDGVSTVELEVTRPNGSLSSFNMENVGGNVWEYNFSDTWSFGRYQYDIVATDNSGATSRNGSSFVVFIAQKSSIQTERDNYYPAEYVNLTDKQDAWWNRSWEYRRELQVNETSGNALVDYPVRLEVPNLGSKVQTGCEDLRVVENQQLQDIYVQSCNPSGTSVVYFSTNVSASASETDQFLYYGNPNASVYPRDRHAYRIVDSGTYDPGKSTIDNTHIYNSGNATFRQIDITVYGNNLQASVEAYNYVTETWDTLYSGAPASGTNIVNNLYLDNPQYSKVNVQLEDTGGNPSSVYYGYNFTTPDYTDAYNYSEEDKLPSLIQNTGNTSFQGRVLLEVERNTTGSWQDVSVQHNDSAPRSLAPGSIVNFANLWNDNPFYTGTKESGFYRAVYRFMDPSGEVLSDSNGAITGNYIFRLNPPQSQVRVEDLRVYNVTGSGTPRTDTTDLEDSGTNSTLRIYGGDTYRFDIVVNNSQNADANWRIQSGDVIRHYGLNSSWAIDPATEIFYSNQTQSFTGGSFNGTIEWNTQGGIVKPGDNATFSYIIDVPNTGEYHDILFEINDLGFTETDDSDLDVVKREQQPPAPLLFQLNTTGIIQGEKLKAYANWTEDIASAEAEYNSTFSTLNNFSVTPAGSWTNYTVSTDTNWVRGNHSFRFYASDFSGNLNATRKEWFAVFAESQVNASEVNQTRVNPGSPVRFRCQVADSTGSAIQDYNVSFYNETALLGYNLTNTDGWASTKYSSNSIGYQNLTCEISADYEKFYKPSDSNATETVRIAEDLAPNYFQYSANRTRVFKTTTNNTFGVQSFWTDNWELDFGALVEGTVYTFRNSTLPYSPFDPVQLSGTRDWANFTVDIPNNYSMGDYNWTVYVNDTSSNINNTGKMPVDVWAWAFVDSSNSGPSKNPVGQGEEFTFYCDYRQGNGTGVVNYPVRFWDNNTATGDWRYLGQNETQTGSLQGFAQWTTSYLDTGAYEIKCNASESSALNIKPYQGYHNFSTVMEVQTGDVNPPVIINDNYFLNDTDIFKVGGAIESMAQWNETIDLAWVEYNTTNTSFTQEYISKPYSDNWTNFTLKTDGNWSVGEHWIKTYANDTKGNLNDTLEYLKFDVWGYSRVEWLSPTGTVAKSNSTELRCGVYDNATGEGIANYSVSFYDDNSSLIGTNTTDTQGEAVYFYNTSGLSTGSKTWSCRIQDEPSLHYNTSSQDTASETVNLVNEVTAYLTGSLVEPPSGTTLAQNQTFTANVSISCNAGGCGQVNATMRYNASGTTADTAMPSGSGTPFHTVGQNRKSCGTLAQGESCYIDWQVNATGALNSYHSLDALLEGENTQNNDTEDNRVSIDVVLITNITYEFLAFGTGSPGDVLSAPRNGQGKYTIKLDENSNAATGGVWMKETPLQRKTGPDTSNRRILPENTSWSMESSCAYTGSEPLHETFSQITSYLGSGDSLSQCFWQEIPYGKYNGTYNGTITIKVNATE
ncbi:MAG: LamG-like jellyroll fold domain-containing protein [Candidatus Nanohaloarchaea archaeon]